MLCKKELCCGCGACANACENGAVQMVQNEMGFLYPRINSEKCIRCGACSAVCPGLSLPERPNLEDKVLGSFAVDLAMRKKSSSGGIFTLLAEKAFTEGGYVFGAAFDENFLVKHIAVKDKEGLERIRCSKYAQSDPGTSYRECKDALSAGEKVLFSGTPCQIAGLYKFLGGDHSGLVTVDILCHGAPSPSFWRYYLELLEEKYASKAVKVTFKSKSTGWHCASVEVSFKNGKRYHKIKDRDPFMRAFLKNYILRDSCFDCRYAGSERCGDITLGDFWGYKAERNQYKDNDTGISFVKLNTEKGERFFNAVRGRTASVQKSLSSALPGNITLKKGVSKPQDYMDFWKMLAKEGFPAVKKKYLKPERRALVNRLLWTKPGIALRGLIKK